MTRNTAIDFSNGLFRIDFQPFREWRAIFSKCITMNVCALWAEKKNTSREKKEINKKKKNTLCTNICKRAHKRFCCVCDCKYTRFIYTNVYKRLFCADIISNIELETLQTLNIYVYVRIYAVSFLFR